MKLDRIFRYVRPYINQSSLMEGNKSNTFFCMDGCVNLNRIFRCVRPTGIFPRLPRRRMVEKKLFYDMEAYEQVLI